jgi:hypothetical protein
MNNSLSFHSQTRDNTISGQARSPGLMSSLLFRLICMAVAALFILSACDIIVQQRNVAAPEPQNMPIPQGAEKVRVVQVPATSTTTSYWKTTFETMSSQQSIIDFYKANLRPDGWTVESETPNSLHMKWVEDKDIAPWVFNLTISFLVGNQGRTQVELHVRSDKR